jgi:hypothetical protein
MQSVRRSGQCSSEWLRSWMQRFNPSPALTKVRAGTFSFSSLSNWTHRDDEILTDVRDNAAAEKVARLL